MGGVQVDPDKAFAVQIAHEENVVTSSVSYIQCALLYTSSTGERRIRFVNSPISPFNHLSFLLEGDAIESTQGL